MCGIAGILARNSHASADKLAAAATAMCEAIKYRGPDDSGSWVDAAAGLAFSHRRLSIVDVSSAGHQPMISGDGRYVINYNGEVYNCHDIRPDLEARGIRFRGHSDTEVMVEAIAAFGLRRTLERLAGMFALAVWDRRERTLFLARDRLGIKPLYWASFGNLFLFGSELKALRAHPGWTPHIDRRSVAAYLRLGYVPAPHTIYDGVRKLEPGTVLTRPWNGEPVIDRFWDAHAVACTGRANPLPGSESELTDQLEALLQDAVSHHMLADVPLGAFLSGGIDSSTIVALMQAANVSKVRTFTIGFETDDFNEASHAAAVARHLGTQHTELTVTGRQGLDVIPNLPDWYDEPFADSSQIPTFLVSSMTRRHVTVTLSGDGGDELFAGYNRYQLTRRLWRGASVLPRVARRGIAGTLASLPPDRLDRLFSFLPGRLRPPQLGAKMHKLAAILKFDDTASIYRHLTSYWDPAELMPDVEPHQQAWDRGVDGELPGMLEKMQFLDLVTYLPDDILTKLDRASMVPSLESRVPFLDHRVVEFAWRLPSTMKIRRGKGKWLLRKVLYRHVPPELVDRPKMGFGIPLAEWLRGPLRDWAATLLSEARLREGGLVDAARVQQAWKDHQERRRDAEHQLWNILMLEAWRERWC